MRQRWRLLAALAAVGLALVLLTSEHPAIWPARNIALYKAERWWQSQVGRGQPVGVGSLHGCVSDPEGAPIAGSTVLVAERDGLLHRDETGAKGCYALSAIPAGRYAPLASAEGYRATAARPWGLPIRLSAGERQRLDFRLAPFEPPALSPGTDLRIGAPLTVTRELPRPGTAVRRELRFTSGDRANQLTLLYTPSHSRGPLPTLLAVYPGAADLWEGVSVPLAAAGFAVIAVGPEYALDLEPDIAELQRLLAFARSGKLPGVDGGRVALLGGSYSSLHVQRLVQRGTNLRSAVLLGAAGDLFDLRRRFETGTFSPPFGLERALIALGRPSTSPERYWRYSALYHLRSDMPPMLLMHSRDDKVVPYQQSKQLAAALARLGVPHEAHFFTGMSHYLRTDTPSRDVERLYELTLGFLRRTLGTPGHR